MRMGCLPPSPHPSKMEAADKYEGRRKHDTIEKAPVVGGDGR